MTENKMADGKTSTEQSVGVTETPKKNEIKTAMDWIESRNTYGAKVYEITENCFEGDKGDIVAIDWNAYDSSLCLNATKNTTCSPFCSVKCIVEVAQ
jgi:hypothetical protein